MVTRSRYTKEAVSRAARRKMQQLADRVVGSAAIQLGARPRGQHPGVVDGGFDLTATARWQG